MCQHKNFAKSSYVDTFFPNSGSAAVSSFFTAFAVVARVAAAEPELGKMCQHKNFWQSSYLDTFFESSYVTTWPLV